MRMRKVASLGDVISSKRFASVYDTASKLNRLEAILGLYLDQTLRAACHISSFADGDLTLVTPHPTVASQLRYLSRIFMQQLRTHGEFGSLKRIKVLAYAPVVGGPSRPPKPRMQLSRETAALLRDTAVMLDDPEISGALERLARHGDDPSDAATAIGATPGKNTSY